MSRCRAFSSRSSNTCPSTNYSAKSGPSSEIVIDPDRPAKADVAKHVSTGHENDLRDRTLGPFPLVAGTGFEPATSGL